MNLAEFLLTRITEDEAAALAAQFNNGKWSFTGDWLGGAVVRDFGPDVLPWRSNSLAATDATHIARWDPARVLAECEAKRRIVEREARWRRTKDNVTAESFKAPDDMVTVTWLDEQFHPHEERVTHAEFRDRFTEPSPPSHTLRLLALPYADHPDYNPSWSVE